MLLHSAVEEILRSGKVPTHDGQVIEAFGHIPSAECELLYRQVAATGATQAIEIGMGFGVSTLCLCDALSKTPPPTAKSPHLVVIDLENWEEGLGLQNLRSAGFGDMVEFHKGASQAVLPQLAAKGYRVRFAFIDGWHTFDHALIDFFYIDQMLENRGVIVFDDVAYPAINAVVRFVLANRNYELVETLEYPVKNRGKRLVKRFLRRLGRTDKDPDPAHQNLLHQVEQAHSVALRKVSTDTRRWDHYCAF